VEDDLVSAPFHLDRQPLRVDNHLRMRCEDAPNGVGTTSQNRFADVFDVIRSE